MRSLGKAILAALMCAVAVPTAAQAPPTEAPTAAARPATAATTPAPSASPTVPPAPAPTAARSPTAAAPAPAADLAMAAPGVAPLNPQMLESFLDGWIGDAMAREHIAGATVSVVQNGQVILKKGYGFANLEPRQAVDPDRTIFRIGSISKTFTWVLLMREVEAGRIRLDRPINLYLPERVRLTGRSRDLTVGRLLDHTGGFEDRALGQLFEDDPRRVRPLELYLRQERPTRVREAGVLSSYSNYGAALAGEATAFVSGKSFERRVEDEIALPLGMTRTTFREPRPERRGLPAAMPQALWPDVARGYGWRDAGFFPNDYEFIGQVAPAGSASSTAGDMSRYMLMLLNGGSWHNAMVFGPQAAQAFRTPLRKTPAGINGWANGFMTFDLPGGHRGYGHLGHTLAFKSNMTLVPDLGLGIFVATNSETGDRLSDNLPEAVVRRFYAPPQTFPRAGSRELVAAGETFGGYYLTTRRAHGGLEGFVGLLIGGAEVSVTPGGRLITQRQGQSRAWVPEGPLSEGRFISATGDERMVFQFADGRAASFIPATNTETMKRAAFWHRPNVLLFATALTLAAALATLIGVPLRNRRDLRQNQIQSQAALVQNIQAGLWIAAIVFFAIWASGSGDLQRIMYGWPGPLVVTASASALVAAALTLVTVAALPAVWQGGRRVDSWSLIRKAFFTLTVLIYTGYSILLAANGALEPWSR